MPGRPSCSKAFSASGIMPCTESGPERETRVRAISPMRPTVPPP